jgi:phosphoglycolate phosphatase-like HAD superfamily hydrolase
MAMHERDYERRVTARREACFLPGTRIEVVREPAAHDCRHVLFDFDGTLSLIRAGWTEVMVAMMVDVLLETPRREEEAELESIVKDYVTRLTGKQTVYQMIQLAEEVRKRGGTSLDPLEYKRTYLDRLMERIRDRREALRVGRVAPEEMLVPCAFEILEGLRSRGLPMYLASGTDECYVREEAELLRLTPYFGERVYGAVDDYTSYSKQMVIERILRENEVEGASLLGFGDGYVEIDNIKSAGGTAVGVASDEAGRSGRPDPWKRDRLIGIGADLIIPDYRDQAALLEHLFESE